jgi:hypothetical protein
MSFLQDDFIDVVIDLNRDGSDSKFYRYSTVTNLREVDRARESTTQLVAISIILITIFICVSFYDSDKVQVVNCYTHPHPHPRPRPHTLALTLALTPSHPHTLTPTLFSTASRSPSCFFACLYKFDFADTHTPSFFWHPFCECDKSQTLLAFFGMIVVLLAAFSGFGLSLWFGIKESPITQVGPNTNTNTLHDVKDITELPPYLFHTILATTTVS